MCSKRALWPIFKDRIQQQLLPWIMTDLGLYRIGLYRIYFSSSSSGSCLFVIASIYSVVVQIVVNLLAVTSNMYLLPGLRVKGLKLSKGEETPGKMERKRKMT